MFRASVVPNALLATIFVALFSVTSPATLIGEDNFEGAVWKFDLQKNTLPKNHLNGQYRVFNHVMFQKDSPADPHYSKRVGKNNPKGTTTSFEVDDFRAFTRQKKQVRMKGAATLSLVEYGEWTGVFTDRRGVEWEITIIRIEE